MFRSFSELPARFRYGGKAIGTSRGEGNGERIAGRCLVVAACRTYDETDPRSACVESHRVHEHVSKRIDADQYVVVEFDMKKCQQCSKPATLHITEVMEGEGTALHLCETCAQDYLNTVQAGESPEWPDWLDSEDDDEPDIDDSLEAALSDVDEELPAEELREADAQKCPNCGITFTEFRKVGRLGCPQ